jgi:glycosyl transferase family 25
LVRAGVKAERVPASTPADVDPDLIALQSDAKFKRGVRPLRPTELACTHSHLRVWRTMLRQDYPAVAVFEDDAVLGGPLARFLAHPDLERDGWYDLIRLETRQRPHHLGTASQSIEGVALRRLMSTARGTAGYIIHRRAAERLINSEDLARLAIDQVLTGSEGNFVYVGNVLHAIPGLVRPSDPLSELGKSDVAISAIKLDKRVGKMKWLLRHIANRSHRDVIVALPRRIVPFAL